MATWTTPKSYSDSVTLTAAELNTYQRDNLTYLYDRLAQNAAVLSSDVTKSTGTFSDLTGLSFSVANGKNYNFQAVLTYEHSTNTGGPIIGCNHPGGSVRMMVTYTGETSTTSIDRDWVIATDTATGIATANAAGTPYMIWVEGRYQATASGTFALRVARATAGTLTIHKGSALTIVSD